MFSTVKSLYVFFSSSVRHWDVLKKYLLNLSLKPLNDTGTEEKFVSFLMDSKDLAKELQLEDLTLPWIRRDETIDDPTKRNKIEFYYYLLDIVITSLDERLSQLKAHCDYFDFLYDIDELKNTAPDSLDTKCRNLTSNLQDHESSDIDALELRDNQKVLSTLLKPGIGPKEILKFMGRHNFCPNVNTALRIPLTLSVTVASRKRSFSKLKLIKTNLRSTMNKIHLNDLATISIENELVEDLHYTDHVKEFAEAKARKFDLSSIFLNFCVMISVLLNALYVHNH
ncbi:uncharacterized protein LOC124722656 [Schistocerca piceifrons]|uniref:uncharacterized protein LOC124722656 n=1 Tax=Schistocerca piceifrons TaxID=274613 RepID=UPI001F5FBFFC|nr:uncharacterized protein LOC124722656 [Schistocerca piceifrons]